MVIRFALSASTIPAMRSLHFPRRLVGEGDRQEPVRIFALRYEPGDPGRDGARLARARARENQEGPVLMAHRFELLRIEVEKAEAFHGSSPRTNLPITSG